MNCRASVWQRRGIQLLLFSLWSSTTLINAERIEFDGTLDIFIGDLIDNFQLISPTVIFHVVPPEICFTSSWTLCLEDMHGQEELISHLKAIHLTRKQDAILFTGNGSSENLLMKLVKSVPSIFTSGCPVFMPFEYADLLDLRLDSNIIFFQPIISTGYNLLDRFAVKGGQPITLEL